MSDTAKLTRLVSIGEEARHINEECERHKDADESVYRDALVAACRKMAVLQTECEGLISLLATSSDPVIRETALCYQRILRSALVPQYEPTK